MVSSDVCTLSCHFWFFCAQLSENFLKIVLCFSQKLGANIVFSSFLVLSLIFENSLSFSLLKHYKIWVSAFVCVFVVLREEKRGKNDNCNSWFVFLVQNWPFRDG